MTLYELNKTNYSNMPTLNHEEIMKIKKEVVEEFIRKHPAQNFFMLQHEMRYYTLFHSTQYSPKRMAKKITGIAETLGKIKAIETNDTMLEFWIVPPEEEEAFMFGVIPYDKGVIMV